MLAAERAAVDGPRGKDGDGGGLGREVGRGGGPGGRWCSDRTSRRSRRGHKSDQAVEIRIWWHGGDGGG